MSSLAYGPALTMCCGCSAQGPVARAALLSAFHSSEGLACAALLELFPWPAYIQTIPDDSQYQPCHWVMVIPLPRLLSLPGWYPEISLVFRSIAWSGRIGSRGDTGLDKYCISTCSGPWSMSMEQ